MKKSSLIRLMTIAGITTALAACSNMTPRQRDIATGTGLGAATGAIISSTTGGKSGVGAAVGGVVGAIGGDIYARNKGDY